MMKRNFIKCLNKAEDLHISMDRTDIQKSEEKKMKKDFLLGHR